MAVDATGPSFSHTPVMLEQCMELLDVQPGGVYADGTAGGGGHTRRILELSAPQGRVLGLDRDPEAITHCRQALAEFGERLTLQQANFGDIPQVVERLGWEQLDGMMVDLGVSSHQLDSPERGFSFAEAGPLDMRMGPDAEMTAADLIRELKTDDLADLIYGYGEERHSRRIARVIKAADEAGELTTTADLARVIARASGGRRGRQRIHPATRTFQALRIAVNGELKALDRLLDEALGVLKPGGRLVIIAFHSLEDRRVKRRFARWAGKLTGPQAPLPPIPEPTPKVVAKLVTPKVVKASASEIADNPRARSARLRAVERLR